MFFCRLILYLQFYTVIWYLCGLFKYHKVVEMSATASASTTTEVKQHQSINDQPKSLTERVSRGDKEGKIKLEGIPKFEDKYEEREWVKEHMAAAFRFWGRMGYGEGLAGHITVVDPVDPSCYWMNPICVHFGVMTKSKLALVGPDGHVRPEGAQLPINTAGFYIHSSIHKARPDIKAAGHTHTLYGKSWSVFGKPIDIMSQDSCLFYNNLAVYKNFGGIVLAQQEGENIAAALGKAKNCILQVGILSLLWYSSYSQ